MNPQPRNRGVVGWLNATFKHWSLLPAVVLFVVLTVYPIAQPVADERVDDRVSRRRGASGRSRRGAIGTRCSATRRSVRRSSTRSSSSSSRSSVEMVLGLGLALLVGGMTRGKGFMRTIMIMPILVPPVAIGSMFKLMYNHDFGVFNQVLAAGRASGR